MDLTAAIRLKIERLRNSKTLRYNALSSSIERDVANLTQHSAELFTKLEDALEATVMGKSEELEELMAIKEEDEDSDEDEGDGDKVDAAPVKLLKPPEQQDEIDDVDEDKEGYYANEMDISYGQPQAPRSYYEPVVESKASTTSLYAGVPRPPSRTPSLPTKQPQKDDTTTASTAAIPAASDIHPPSKASNSKPFSESPVAYLRRRAQETQTALAEKHTALTELRKKHDLAMKRLDRLQADLEKISQRWEAEERDRIQSESTTALGKRKREGETPTTDNKRWKTIGLKGIEWGVLFGIGVASAVGVSKLNQ